MEMLFAESKIIDLGNPNQRMGGITEKMEDVMDKGEALLVAVRMDCGFRMCCRALSFNGPFSMLSLEEKILSSLYHFIYCFIHTVASPALMQKV